jgi:hypothetical protein
MQFSLVDDFFVVSRITGPHHNLLQLRLQQGAQGQAKCEALGPSTRNLAQALDEAALVSEVAAGVAEAGARLGHQFSATHIRYVTDDSRPESTYRLLAAELVRHFADRVIG